MTVAIVRMIALMIGPMIGMARMTLTIAATTFTTKRTTSQTIRNAHLKTETRTQETTRTTIVTSQQNQPIGFHQSYSLHFFSVRFTHSSMGCHIFSSIHSWTSLQTVAMTLMPDCRRT